MTYKRKVQIENCTLILGDCLDVMPTLDKVDSVLSDPPFGMGFHSSFRMESTKHKKIKNDDTFDMLKFACNIKAIHSKYIFCRWDNLYNVTKPNSCVTWVKNNHSMGDLNHEHARQTELILFYRGDNHFFPNKRPTDIIFAKKTQNELHPTQKPVDLMARIIGWTDGIIVDPFMGSGSTLVACAKTGRHGIGIELDEEYFNIACRRVEDAYKQGDLFL